MRNTQMIVAVLVVAGVLAAIGALRWSSGAETPPATNPATLQQLVKAEVERQLPALLELELQRQLDRRAEAARKELEERNREYMIKARGMSAASTLQTFRSQLVLWQVQHRDRFPTIAELEHWKVLLERTDENGRISPKGNFGPYISAPPRNPFNNQSDIASPGKATAATGWIYNPRTGSLKVVLPASEKPNAATLSANDYELLADQ